MYNRGNMAGSIIVRYAQKTYKQQRAEKQDAHGVFKELNHSVDIVPESISFMTFSTWKEAKKFAVDLQEKGHHILEMKDDYRN